MCMRTTPELAQAVVQVLLSLPNIIKVTPTFFFNLIESDPDDNKFVDCAICGSAELIVTNDSHFNVLKQINFPHIEVKTIQEYIVGLRG